MSCMQDGSTDGTKGSGFPVQHLPPVLLHLSFPSAYPSEQPPDMHLDAIWANSDQLQQLTAHLSSMWEDQAGLPICYTWVDWLQQNALSHLGISGTLILRSSRPTSPNTTLNRTAQSAQELDSLQDDNHSKTSEIPESQRNQSQAQSQATTDACQSPSAEQILMNILRYDAAEKYHAFQQGTWSCGICFEQFSGKQCVQASLQCGHVYCQDCMGQHCALHVKEGTLEHLRCPEPDCKEALDRQVHKRSGAYCLSCRKCMIRRLVTLHCA